MVGPVKNTIAVIIPVFNACTSFKELVRTLKESYPTPESNLRFIVSDDASTDSDVKKFYQTELFFKRKDVHVVLNKKNLGFTRNINHAIQKTMLTEDLVLLNSDTKISGRLFHSLQSSAYSLPLVGSVTPLSNNGTIASVFNWPNGATNIEKEDHNHFQKIVRHLKPKNQLVQIPTAVGFCWFIQKSVFNEVGYFDEKNFLRGYGEENDWCMRAQNLGYRHFLSLNDFVFHASGQSFGTEKIKLLNQSSLKLNKIHPTYPDLVNHHIEINHWQAERFLIMLSFLNLNPAKKIKIYVLHNDPEFYAGGVEVHVKEESSKALLADHRIIQVFLFGKQIKIRLIFNQSLKQEFAFDFENKDVLYLLWKTLSHESLIYVHHLVGYPKYVRNLIQQLPQKNRFFILHDYWSICPAINLISKDGTFCGLPNLKSCNSCLKINYKIHDLDIKDYRHEFSKFISSFEEVSTPSLDSKRILEKGFRLAQKRVNIKVKGNPVSWPKFSKSTSKQEFAQKIIFLGAFSPHKGARLISNAIPLFDKVGLKTEVWGMTGAIRSKVPFINIRYESKNDLMSLRDQAQGAIVCLPFLWPETFSYTLYEALTILQVPVVVGPFGHPATLVQNLSLGTVMKKPDTPSLFAALSDCMLDYKKYLKNTANFQMNFNNSKKNEEV